jgi:hypothetical protein
VSNTRVTQFSGGVSANTFDWDGKGTVLFWDGNGTYRGEDRQTATARLNAQKAREERMAKESTERESVREAQIRDLELRNQRLREAQRTAAPPATPARPMAVSMQPYYVRPCR